MCTSPEGILLFFDEVDALASVGNLTSIIRGTLLDYLSNDKNGIRAKDSKIIIMMATNFYEILDQAVIRKGRIDDHFLMDNPSEESGEKILNITAQKGQNTKIESVLIKKIYNNLCKKLKENEKSKIMCNINLPKEHKEIIDDILDNIRPSGIEIIECFNSIKMEAYHTNNISENMIEITENVIDNFFKI